MTIKIDDPSEFELKGMLWSGAEKTLEKIIDADKFDDLVDYIETAYDGEIELTELNDILRFEFDQLKKDIGIYNLDDEVDVKALKNFQDDIMVYQKPRMITNGDMLGYELLSTGEISESDLSEQIDEITSKLNDIENDIFEITDVNDVDDLESAKDNLEEHYDELRNLLDDYVDDKSKVYKDLWNFDISRFFYNI